MRKLVMGGALGMFLLSMVLVACGGSGGDVADPEARRFQDMWEIDKIEKDFHGAMSEKNVGQMMALFAPNATMTVGPGETATGLEEIRTFWEEKSATFAPENEWISDHPAYKLEITVDGDRGRCTSSATSSMPIPARSYRSRPPTSTSPGSTGSWLITNMIGGTAVLEV